jgi:hypothetical protein
VETLDEQVRSEKLKIDQQIKDKTGRKNVEINTVGDYTA